MIILFQVPQSASFARREVVAPATSPSGETVGASGTAVADEKTLAKLNRQFQGNRELNAIYRRADACRFNSALYFGKINFYATSCFRRLILFLGYRYVEIDKAGVPQSRSQIEQSSIAGSTPGQVTSRLDFWPSGDFAIFMGLFKGGYSLGDLREGFFYEILKRDHRQAPPVPILIEGGAE